jgi:hypothetical protein
MSLEIVGGQARVLPDPGEHPGPYLLAIVESPDEVGPPDARERDVGAAPTLLLPPQATQRSEDARCSR